MARRLTGWEWKRTPTAAWYESGRLNRWKNDVKVGVLNVMDDFAETATDWMQGNAPWADRTGNARASLTAYAQNVRGRPSLVLSYGEDIYYAWYLERDHGGKFAIIIPGLHELGVQVMARVRSELGLT